ncbi:MAG: heparinase II/III-family protein, partial [Tannerella sp.]|nr:heparinase II/III-family protein [Tannerella sp.]
MKYLHILTIAILFASQLAIAQPQIKDRKILENEAQNINLAEALSKTNAWSQMPTYKDRTFTATLPKELVSSYIEKAEEYLNYNWPVVKATDYLEIIRSGERHQEVYAACSNALISLVMGEMMEGKGRFIDQIINAVWYFSEQTWWGWSAHLTSQKVGSGLPDVNEPIVDLGVGEITSNLSWTLYLFKEEFDKVHPLIAQRLKQELLNKSLEPYFIRNDFWYQGFNDRRPNNWNPWINYNMLTSYLLIEDDAQRLTARVDKVLRSVDKFLNAYPDDGGCDEGPSYWGAAGAYLYEILEIMKNATSGKFDVFDNQLVQNIGKYFYQVNIHAPYFINFADADAKTGGAGSTVYRYGKAINDPVMWKFGAYLADLNKWATRPIGGKIGSQLRDLKLIDEIKNADKAEALVADFWLPETDIAGGRDKAGSFEGFFFGAKGGFNNESHNHNDVGTCLMYFDGKPCLIDAGRETYVAKTFSSRRYEIWTMQSGYHNLPVINGVDQMNGEEYKASNSSFKASASTVFYSTDIATAYPEAAKVKSWVRNYTLKRGKSFTIGDKYQLKELVGLPISSNLLTSCKVSILKPGLLKFEGEGFNLVMTYNAKIIKPEIEPLQITDKGLKRYWPNDLTRIRMVIM